MMASTVAAESGTSQAGLEEVQSEGGEKAQPQPQPAAAPAPGQWHEAELLLALAPNEPGQNPPPPPLSSFPGPPAALPSPVAALERSSSSAGPPAATSAASRAPRAGRSSALAASASWEALKAEKEAEAAPKRGRGRERVQSMPTLPAAGPAAALASAASLPVQTPEAVPAQAAGLGPGRKRSLDELIRDLLPSAAQQAAAAPAPRKPPLPAPRRSASMPAVGAAAAQPLLPTPEVARAGGRPAGLQLSAFRPASQLAEAGGHSLLPIWKWAQQRHDAVAEQARQLDQRLPLAAGLAADGCGRGAAFARLQPGADSSLRWRMQHLCLPLDASIRDVAKARPGGAAHALPYCHRPDLPCSSSHKQTPMHPCCLPCALPPQAVIQGISQQEGLPAGQLSVRLLMPGIIPPAQGWQEGQRPPGSALQRPGGDLWWLRPDTTVRRVRWPQLSVQRGPCPGPMWCGITCSRRWRHALPPGLQGAAGAGG